MHSSNELCTWTGTTEQIDGLKESTVQLKEPATQKTRSPLGPGTAAKKGWETSADNSSCGKLPWDV